MYYALIAAIIIGIALLIVRFRSIVLLGFEMSLAMKQFHCAQFTKSLDLMALSKLQRRVRNMERRLYAFEQRRIKEGYVCPTKKEILIASSWLWTPNDQKRFIAVSRKIAALDEQLTDLTQPVDKALDRWMRKT